MAERMPSRFQSVNKNCCEWGDDMKAKTPARIDWSRGKGKGCGRYYRGSDKQRIAEAFKLGKLPDGFVLPDLDFNVAPTTFPTCNQTHTRETGQRELVMMR
jgi:hypothetical protein